MTREQHILATGLLGQAWSAMEEGSPRGAETAKRLTRRFLRLAGRPEHRNAGGRPIVCRTEPGIRYPSIAIAAQALGVKHTNTIRSAIMVGGTVAGMFFRYEDTPESDCPPMVSKYKPVKWNGEKYPSIKEAAEATCPPGVRLKTQQERVRRKALRLERTV